MDSRGVGGVLHLPEALEQHPNSGIITYTRVSSWGQAGRGKVHLEAKSDALVTAVRTLAPGKLKRIVRAIEGGKLTDRRPRLREAAADARRRDCILVTADLSRFLRAGAYSRTKNRRAWPTQAEFEQLRSITFGIPLATLESPYLTEDQRHSLATRRTGKAGRPHSIDDGLAADLFDFLGPLFPDFCGRWRWMYPLAAAAKRFGVTTSAIQRASLRPSPSGKSWRELAIEKAAESGLLEITDTGHILFKVYRRDHGRGWYGKRGRPPKWCVWGCR